MGIYGNAHLYLFVVNLGKVLMLYHIFKKKNAKILRMLWDEKFTNCTDFRFSASELTDIGLWFQAVPEMWVSQSGSLQQKWKNMIGKPQTRRYKEAWTLKVTKAAVQGGTIHCLERPSSTLWPGGSIRERPCSHVLGHNPHSIPYPQKMVGLMCVYIYIHPLVN